MKAPRWFTVALYVLMGWAAIFVLVPLYRVVGAGGLAWLLAGGVIYSLGGLGYALKKPNLWKGFGFHEVFHVCCLLGSACHWWMIFRYV
jgi:hemolysin III